MAWATAFAQLPTFAGCCIITSMRLKDYFIGERFRLHSPMSARMVAEHINEAAGSALWPFTTGVVGGVWSGLICLRYRSSLFEYNAKPVLAGRLHTATGGSNLELRYRAPLWVYGFYLFWYLSLTLIIFSVIAFGWTPEIRDGEKAIDFGIFALLLVTPLGLHTIGTHRSEVELAYLIDFLSRHAEAKR
jgi:hypothetical protein